MKALTVPCMQVPTNPKSKLEEKAIEEKQEKVHIYICNYT